MGVGLRGLLAGVLMALIAAPGVAEVKVYPLGSETRLYSEAKLGKHSQKYFRDFKKDALYFGAFYVNSEEDVSWYLTGMPSIKDAERIALTECERESKGKNRCKLYALLVPKGFPAGAQDGGGVSEPSAKTFHKDYLKNVKPGKYAALVQNGMGGSGFAWGYDSAEDAIDRATLHCQANLSTYLTTFSREARNNIKKLGLATCSIIDKRGP